MAYLEFKHVGKVYPNGFEAVKDLNLSCEKNEFVVLVDHQGVARQHP